MLFPLMFIQTAQSLTLTETIFVLNQILLVDA